MNEAFTVPAARGAALLDKAVPDWYKVVDTDTLNISSCHYCVAGQVGQALHPELYKQEGYLGVVRMALPPWKRWDLVMEVYQNGFCVSVEQGLLSTDPNRVLTRAWINEIHARRAMDQATADAVAEVEVETVDRAPVLV